VANTRLAGPRDDEVHRAHPANEHEDHHTNRLDRAINQPTSEEPQTSTSKRHPLTHSLTMAFNVPIGVAYGVLYAVLLLFTLLAVMTADWFPAKHLLSYLCLSSPNGDGVDSTDHFLSARNSAGPFAIGISFFASGMGAWVRN
jgi:hypothetical protein